MRCFGVLVFWLALLKPINKTSLSSMRQCQAPGRDQEQWQVGWSCEWAYNSGKKPSWTIDCDGSNNKWKMAVFCVCLDILKESRTRNATVTTRLANLRLNSISWMFTQTQLYFCSSPSFSSLVIAFQASCCLYPHCVAKSFSVY